MQERGNFNGKDTTAICRQHMLKNRSALNCSGYNSWSAQSTKRKKNQ